MQLSLTEAATIKGLVVELGHSYFNIIQMSNGLNSMLTTGIVAVATVEEVVPKLNKQELSRQRAYKVQEGQGQL